MENTEMIMLKHDAELLKQHLLKSTMPEFNKQKLISEIKNARIVKEDSLPPNVVSLNSEVQIRDTESAKEFNFQIVMPGEADFKKNRISVFAPIGIALLGNREGAKVQWVMPNGLKTFTILKVSHEHSLAKSEP